MVMISMLLCNQSGMQGLEVIMPYRAAGEGGLCVG